MKKLQQQAEMNMSLSEPLPHELVLQGIVKGDASNGLQAGHFKCNLCDMGPFPNLSNMQMHLKSKKHLKALEPCLPEPKQPPPAPLPEAEKAEKLAQKAQRMPREVP
eukprot:4758507-Amphidinium_carterae.1